MADSAVTLRITDSFADSGRQSVQETLHCKGFINLTTDGHGLTRKAEQADDGAGREPRPTLVEA